MVAVGQVLKLKPGAEKEYKRRHDELWPEMANAMRAAGVNMVIYRYENLLFVYANVPSQETWDYLTSNPIKPRWDAYMADILEAEDDGALFVKNLSLMFKFGNLA